VDEAPTVAETALTPVELAVPADYDPATAVRVAGPWALRLEALAAQSEGDEAR